MKTLKTYLFALVLLLVSVTVFVACDNDDDTHTHEPVPVTSTPVEIIVSNQIEIDGSNGSFQDFIQIDKPCLFTVNASTSVNGIANAAALTLRIRLNESDVALDGSSTQITSSMHASASTTLFLEPGTYNLEVDRFISGTNNSLKLRINYHAIYAEMAN